MPRRPALALAAALLVGAAIGVGLALGRGRGAAPPRITGWSADRLVPPLALVEASGRRTSLAAFRGRFVVLAPSLTLCHEVCPLTTGALMRMRRAVEAAGLADRVVFAEATVDPWRDSPARLRAYARMTGARFQLLTGSRAQIARLWRFFGVGYRRVPQGKPADVDWWTHKPERFDVEHTDGLFFIDPSGRERLFIVGMANVGGHLSRALTSLLSATGHSNLEHPVGAWTVRQALDDLGHLLGRRIPLAQS